MIFVFCLFASFFHPILTAECTYPADIEIIDDLWDIDFGERCHDFEDDMKGLLSGIESLMPTLMNIPGPDDVPSIVNNIESIFKGFIGFQDSAVTCIGSIISQMCQTNQFKQLRALLSTFSVSAGLTIGLGVEASVGLSVNPAGLFDMVCLPQDNTQAIYDKMDNLNETFLCALDKQTDVLIETVSTSLKNTENEIKDHLNATRDFIVNTMKSEFRRSEALARTFHEEATANLATLSSFITNSYYNLDNKIDTMAKNNMEALFLKAIAFKLDSLMFAYEDTHIRKIETLNETCKENNPFTIFSNMYSILASNLLQDIVKYKQYSQFSILNLVVSYKNAMKEAGFFVTVCHPYNITSPKENILIESRKQAIEKHFQKLYQLWEDNYYTNTNIKALVLDALNGTTGVDASNEVIAAAVYKSLFQHFGNSKYYFYAGVRTGESEARVETMEAISSSDTHKIEHFEKTIYVMRTLKASKYVDCFYFDQKNSKVPHFSNETDAMEFHRKLCPGSQFFVHDGYDYVGQHGPGFRSFVLAYKNDSNSLSYVNVVHPLKICEGYCLL